MLKLLLYKNKVKNLLNTGLIIFYPFRLFEKKSKKTNQLKQKKGNNKN